MSERASSMVAAKRQPGYHGFPGDLAVCTVGLELELHGPIAPEHRLLQRQLYECPADAGAHCSADGVVIPEPSLPFRSMLWSLPDVLAARCLPCPALSSTELRERISP